MHPLHQVVDICENMLDRAKDSAKSSSRVFYGHGLFAKASLHGRSILLLASGKQNVDVGAICVLARCTVEIHNAASYLLESNLSKDEAHMRLHLFLLNHSIDLEKIQERLGTARSDFWHNDSSQWSLSELAKNPIFIALDEPHRKNLSKGKSPYIHSRYSGPRLIPKNIESGLYTLFSQSAHSYSLGLLMGGGQATPTGIVNSFGLAIDATTMYLASLALLYWRLRHKAIKQFSAEERRTLEEESTSTRLLTRLSEIKLNTTM
jgi:hypothetical protein